jgi:hypothetical protein
VWVWIEETMVEVDSVGPFEWPDRSIQAESGSL